VTSILTSLSDGERVFPQSRKRQIASPARESTDALLTNGTAGVSAAAAVLAITVSTRHQLLGCVRTTRRARAKNYGYEVRQEERDPTTCRDRLGIVVEIEVRGDLFNNRLARQPPKSTAGSCSPPEPVGGASASRALGVTRCLATSTVFQLQSVDPHAGRVINTWLTC